MTSSTSQHGSPTTAADAANPATERPVRDVLTSFRTVSRRVLRSATTLHVCLLGLLAYVPSLLSSPGQMPADTKLYLYFDPSRLTGDSLYSFDSRQFAGWVPHQTVSYLWPSGPWYSFFDWLGVPDWVAHRLWIATLMFVAGLGVRWAAKLLGVSPSGAFVAAIFYQTSPYILPYISRTSLMLLPWAGLGWLVGLTIRAATRTRWRDVAWFGLIIATVGAANATATMMIAPAPVLWLLHAGWGRLITWRKAAIVAIKLGSISLVMSVWWIAMLSVQGAFGANVLGYSETLEAVSLTSSSTEVLRAMGYWLFYVRDPFGFTTTASFDYMASGRALAITFLILGIALIGLVATRWTSRRFALLLVLVGVVLAVGVHPIDDPSPLMSSLAENSRSGLALAMRSSTRALPLSTFGLALGVGALTTAIRRSRIRIGVRRLVPVGLALLAVANLPVLADRALVDPILSRDQDPPDAWLEASAALDALPDGYRVMQLPGIEFGAFRWGYTVDPPLPGLTGRPLVTRDLLPLGSPGAMDLLYAFDDRFQEGTAEIPSVAPISRLLGVDTIWLPNDVAFDRFRTPRPEDIAALFTRAAADGSSGLGDPIAYGDPTPNLAVIPTVDEVSISNALIGEPLPAVALVPVEDPARIVRVKDGPVVVLAGSGDGVVDAAAAGVLDGHELIRYAADLVADPSNGSIADADRVVITDSNRDRAHHWHSSQDVTGFTEDGEPGPGVLVENTSDQRIPVFVGETAADQTVSEQRGGTRAAASGYGEPFAYRPENRPAMAVDGDPSTAWVVADRAEPIGEFLRLSADDEFETLSLVQPQDGRNRWITAVQITDASGTYAVQLSDASRSIDGEVLTLRAPSTEVTITITATAFTPGSALNALDAVGFAEATSELGPTDEVIRVPSNVLPLVTADQDVDIVLTRLRNRATNRWRADPEPVLVRAFTLADDREIRTIVTARLDPRAPDSAIAALIGWAGTTADQRLTGVPAAGGWAATDGDLTTRWITPFDAPRGATLTMPLASGQALDPAGTTITLQQPVDGTFNTITEIIVSGETGQVTVAVPAPDPTGASTVSMTGLAGSVLRITISATTLTTTTDRRYAEQVLLPVAISEVQAAGITPSALPTEVRTECRTDLLSIDDQPVSVRLVAAVSDLFAGRPSITAPCDDSPRALSAGEHVVRSANGATTAVDIDRVLLSSPSKTSAESPDSTAAADQVEVTDYGRVSRTVRVAPCTDGCWFVFGEGYNEGWTASLDGSSMGTQQQVDGGFNGWYLPPSTENRTIELRWGGQTRLTIGLALGALGALLCLAMIVFDRRRQDPPLLTAPMLVERKLPRPDSNPFARRSPALVATAAATLGGFIIVSPRWGIACGLVAAVCGYGLRRVRLVAVVGVALMGIVTIVMIRRFLDLKPFVNAGWPGNFEDLHRPAMAAIVLLAVDIVISERRCVISERRGGVGPVRASLPTADPPPDPGPAGGADDGVH